MKNTTKSNLNVIAKALDYAFNEACADNKNQQLIDALTKAMGSCRELLSQKKN